MQKENLTSKKIIEDALLKKALGYETKEVVEEVISDKMCNVNLEDKRLNTEELCQRWNISKGTLEKWEKDGRIERLPLGGRKKLFSMADVLRAESEGLIRTAC